MNRLVLPLLGALLIWCNAARAVDFGVMETAVPIENGFFKFIGYPLAVLEGAQREQDLGVAVGVGYGISERWDAEVQVATYDDITFIGTDLEYNFLDLGQLDMSLTAGVHYANLDFGTQRGVDLTYIASYALSDNSNGGIGFTLNAALDMARDEVDLDRPLAAMVDDEYSSVHVVPGLQYRLSPQIDFIAEVGLGINQSSDDYVSVGTSYYFLEQ